MKVWVNGYWHVATKESPIMVYFNDGDFQFLDCARIMAADKHVFAAYHPDFEGDHHATILQARKDADGVDGTVVSESEVCLAVVPVEAEVRADKGA